MSEPLLPADPASIGGHRLLARLGAGGMGVVYLGRTGSGALVAVKVIQAEYADDPGFRARFRREVDLARRVSSPWAVPVTGAEPEAEEPWLATAFVPGPSLGEAVARHGALPVRSVRALARMLARALSAVHDAGLVHRDVKPGNVLLAVDGPRLIDFGIARATDETALTSPDMVVGTPGFLSPEQAEARGAGVGPASDVFSLGCLLAYALTGRPPLAAVRRTRCSTARCTTSRTSKARGANRTRSCVNCCSPASRRTRPPGPRPSGSARIWPRTPCRGRAAAVRPTGCRRTSYEASPSARPRCWRCRTSSRRRRGCRLPSREPRAAVAAAVETTGPGATTVNTSRRRLFVMSGGALLAATAGVGAWAVLRDDDSRGDDNTGPRWAIGVQADLSGTGRAAGRAQEQGARLAIEQYNAREPGKDRPFELTLRAADDGGSAQRAPGAAKKLIRDPDVLAVIGPTSDVTTEAVMGAYDEALLPMLTVSAGGMMMTSRQPRSLVHCRPGDAALSVPIAVHLAQQAAKDKEMAGRDCSRTVRRRRTPGSPPPSPRSCCATPAYRPTPG